MEEDDKDDMEKDNEGDKKGEKEDGEEDTEEEKEEEGEEVGEVVLLDLHSLHLLLDRLHNAAVRSQESGVGSRVVSRLGATGDFGESLAESRHSLANPQTTRGIPLHSLLQEAFPMKLFTAIQPLYLHSRSLLIACHTG